MRAFKQTMLIIVSDISADFRRLINIQWTNQTCNGRILTCKN